MNALYQRMLEEIEANTATASPETTPTPAPVSEAPVAPPAEAASAPAPIALAPSPPIAAAPSGNLEQAAQELDALRGMVLGSQLGGLVDTIARVDAEVAAETQRVRDAIAEVDRRLTTRLDTLVVGGGRDRKQLADELVHLTEEVTETLSKRNSAILETAELQFAELQDKLLDSNVFTGLVSDLVEQLD